MTQPFADSAFRHEADVALRAVREAGLLCRAVQAGIDMGELSRTTAAGHRG